MIPEKVSDEMADSTLEDRKPILVYDPARCLWDRARKHTMTLENVGYYDDHTGAWFPRDSSSREALCQVLNRNGDHYLWDDYYGAFFSNLKVTP